MKDGKSDQRRAWFDLERFRSARAFGQGGCAIPSLIGTALIVVLLVWG
jgi:hypothetical protein